MTRNSLAVQWLGLFAFIAEGLGSVPGWGANIPQATQRGQDKKKRLPKKENFTYIYTHIYIM